RRRLRRLLLLLRADPFRPAARSAVRDTVRPLPGAQREVLSLKEPGPSGRFKARAGLLAVMGLLYASGCGGPYGAEPYVGQTGPGLIILLLFALPWFWSVPMALATAELSTRRPVEGGYYRWVREIFGEYWGFQAGAWAIIASFLDNALYPVL